MDREAEFELIVRRLSDAARLDVAAVPSRPWGDAWFRHNEPYLTITAVSAVVHAELRDGVLDVAGDVLAEADALLTELETDSARELIETGLVESVACLASHDADGLVAERFLAIAPADLARTWRRRTSRLGALAESGLATNSEPPAGLASGSAERRLLTGVSTYRLDDDRWLDLEEIVSADDPSPWILRHPVATGFIFLAVLTAFFLLSIATGAGPFIRE